MAQGVNQSSGKRRAFYSPDPYEASKAAAASFGVVTTTETPILWDFYLNTYFPTVRRRSINWRNQIAWAMDKHISPQLGRMKVDAITRAVLQDFFNDLAAKNLNASSIGKIKIVLSGILNLAEADGLIDRNPIKFVKTDTPKTPQKRTVSPADLYDLFQSADNHTKPLITLLGFCGLRIGETCGAMKADIMDGCLEVRRQVLQLPGGAKTFDTLKTPQSRRAIPLPAELLEAMNVSASLWICANSHGKNMLPNNATRSLDALFKLMKISRVSPHELRHSFISIMENEIGAPRAVVEELAGKAKEGNMGTYSKARMEVKKKWMEKFFEHCKSEFDNRIVVKNAQLEPK